MKRSALKWTTLSVLLGITILPGCKANKECQLKIKGKSNEVVIALGKTSEPEAGFNPIFGATHGTNPLIQSTLVTFDANMKLHNDLATKMTVSEDGKTWEFTIRKDAKFTDGYPVTPQDVVFTFNEIKKSASEIDLTAVDQIKATGDKVEISLKEPQSTFINTVATIGIVPKHAYNKKYGEHPIGSGPYEFVQWEKGEEILLKANKNYYGEKPHIKNVVLLFMEEDAAFAAAKTGLVDIASVSATQATHKIPNMELKVIHTQDNRGITLPVESSHGQQTKEGYPIGNNVTSDLAIRKALVYGLDRKEMVKNTVNGFAVPAFSENDGLPWSNPDIAVETDVAKAKEILKSGGWQKGSDGTLVKNGQKAVFDLYYLVGDSVRQALAMDTANQAERLGIKINVKSGTWDDISKVMFANPILMGWGSTTPQVSYSLFHGKNKYKDDYYNPEGFDNPTVNQYLEKAMAATNQQEAKEFFKKAQWDGKTGSSMLGDAPWVWLVNIDHLYFKKKNLDIGQQPLHPHGAAWPLVANLKEWSFKK